MAMASALDVAQFFLASNPPNSITNLKLQKLCAYAQAVCVAYLGKELFSDSIEMWDLGPVVPNVYHAYKKYDSQCIPQAKLNLSAFTMQQRLVLAGINGKYCEPYDAWGLCEQSHREFPGLRGSNQVLTFKDLQEAFQNNDLVKQLRRADEEAQQLTKEDLKNSIPFQGVCNALAS